MKTLALLFFLSGIGSNQSIPVANINCGIKPIPPIGCDSDDARCVCDAEGNCEWVFDCG